MIKPCTAPISWKMKKLVTISRSLSEAEYHAMAHATSEILWPRNLLASLQVPCTKSTLLHCDNQTALHFTANPIPRKNWTHWSRLSFHQGAYTFRGHNHNLLANQATTSWHLGVHNPYGKNFGAGISWTYGQVGCS